MRTNPFIPLERLSNGALKLTYQQAAHDLDVLLDGLYRGTVQPYLVDGARRRLAAIRAEMRLRGLLEGGDK